MAESVPPPPFRVLSREECDALLTRNWVGRVAFVHGHRIDIVPVHYVLSHGVLCGRTAQGTRLEAASDNFYGAWPIAFEVDEVHALFEWSSVVVHGNLHAAVRGDAEWRRNPGDWEEAAEAFRSLVPTAFSDDDPTPFRTVVFRIDIVEVSGRAAVSGD